MTVKATPFAYTAHRPGSAGREYSTNTADRYVLSWVLMEKTSSRPSDMSVVAGDGGVGELRLGIDRQRGTHAEWVAVDATRRDAAPHINHSEAEPD